MEHGESSSLPDFKKMIWVFVISCLIGYIVEMAFCIVWHGKIENRQSVIYGPFTLVYGVGAVIMCYIVIPISKYGFMPTYLVSAVIGGAVEFVSSYTEELVFSTRSWNYDDQLLSLDGRTSLSMTLAWGMLGYAFVKWIYPFLNKWIETIKISKSKAVCAAMIIFFIGNLTISGLAVDRWMERLHGQQANTRIDDLLDSAYPDSMMEIIFPKIEPVD